MHNIVGDKTQEGGSRALVVEEEKCVNYNSLEGGRDLYMEMDISKGNHLCVHEGSFP